MKEGWSKADILAMAVVIMGIVAALLQHQGWHTRDNIQLEELKGVTATGFFDLVMASDDQTEVLRKIESALEDLTQPASGPLGPVVLSRNEIGREE